MLPVLERLVNFVPVVVNMIESMHDHYSRSVSHDCGLRYSSQPRKVSV